MALADALLHKRAHAHAHTNACKGTCKQRSEALVHKLTVLACSYLQVTCFGGSPQGRECPDYGAMFTCPPGEVITSLSLPIYQDGGAFRDARIYSLTHSLTHFTHTLTPSLTPSLTCCLLMQKPDGTQLADSSNRRGWHMCPWRGPRYERHIGAATRAPGVGGAGEHRPPVRRQRRCV